MESQSSDPDPLESIEAVQSPSTVHGEDQAGLAPIQSSFSSAVHGGDQEALAPVHSRSNSLSSSLNHHERRWQKFSLRFVDNQIDAAFIGEMAPELAKMVGSFGYIGVFYIIAAILLTGSWRSVDAFPTPQAKQLAMHQLYLHLTILFLAFLLIAVARVPPLTRALQS